jgi:hypothetical protein
MESWASLSLADSTTNILGAFERLLAVRRERHGPLIFHAFRPIGPVEILPLAFENEVQVNFAFRGATIAAHVVFSRPYSGAILLPT